MNRREKIKILKMKNFRCFGGEVAFNLDADIVLITGKNGVGKTTILYALSWLLNGKASLFNVKKVGYKNSKEWEIEIPEVKKINNNNYKDLETDEIKATINKDLTTFFQEEVNNFSSLNWLSAFIEYKRNINFNVDMLKKEKDTWINELKEKYLPKSINIDEHRKDFFNKFFMQLRELPEFNHIDNNVDESNYMLEMKMLCRKLSIDYNYQTESDFLEILKKVKKYFEDKLNFKKNKVLENNTNQNLQSSIENNFNNEIIVVSDMEIYKEKINKISNFENVVLFFKDDVLKKVLKKKEALEFAINSFKKEHKRIIKAYMVFSPFGDGFEIVKNYFDKIRNKLKNENINRDLLPQKVINWIINTDIESLFEEYEKWYETMSENMNEINQKIIVLENYLNIIKNGIEFTEEFKSHKIKNGMKVFELIKNNSNSSISKDLSGIYHKIIKYIDFQIPEELNILKQIEENKKKGKYKEKIDEIIHSAQEVIDLESKKSSILNSVVSEISEKERNSIMEPINKILKIFHFPEEYLPMKIKKISSSKYGLFSKFGKEIDYNNFSTGQKTILNIAFKIGANLTFENELKHNAFLFDDITTALDMTQLLPAAILFRKLAYEGKKQVILTTHHESLTNKLLDYLLPPKGNTLKIIEFTDWYNKDTENNWNQYDIENYSKEIDIKTIFSNL